jgi:hypothetical protein
MVSSSEQVSATGIYQRGPEGYLASELIRLQIEANQSEEVTAQANEDLRQIGTSSEHSRRRIGDGIGK